MFKHHKTLFSLARFSITITLSLSMILISFYPVHNVLAAEKLGGYIPVEPDVFEHLPKVPRYRAFLPPKVDLSEHFPTPGMQDAQSCSGWAVGYAARSYYSATLEKRNIHDLANVPSPAYIYNSIRNPRDCGSGALLLDALALLGHGSLSAKDYPIHTCKIPSKLERQRARDFRIKKWFAIDPKQVDDVKGQLARGNPVIFGADVGQSFVDLKGSAVYRGDVIAVGQHAMTIVGFDDERQAFKVINSWGTLWGEKGFGWFDYYAFKRDALEAYTIEIEHPNLLIDDLAVVAPPSPSAEETSPSLDHSEGSKPQVNPKPVPSPGEAQQNSIKIPENSVSDSNCSYVYSKNASGRTVLEGFTGSLSDLAELKKQWRGYADDFAVEFRPWPQCEVLLNLVGMVGINGSPRLTTKSGETRFTEGQEIAFQLTTPTLPSYVYVVYIQADGSVVTLLQPKSDLAPSHRNEVLLFGVGDDGSNRFIAAAPFGTEMVVALSSSSPLFEGMLPRVQTDREFLSSLRRAILFKADRSLGDRRIAASVIGIETWGKK